MRPLFTIPIAGLVTGLIGYLFGFPALRLAGVSLALATLAVAVSLPAIAKRFEHLTGGGAGCRSHYRDAVRVGHRDSALALLRSVGDRGDPVRRRLAPRSGRVGRAWRAIRDGEIAAVSSGVSPAVYKTLAFGVSAAYAGVAGALFAIQVSYINPDTFPIASRSSCWRAWSSVVSLAVRRHLRRPPARVPADLRPGSSHPAPDFSKQAPRLSSESS